MTAAIAESRNIILYNPYKEPDPVLRACQFMAVASCTFKPNSNLPGCFYDGDVGIVPTLFCSLSSINEIRFFWSDSFRP
jgi:hypothetical protein